MTGSLVRLAGLAALCALCGQVPGAEIPVTDPAVVKGLSPYNWISKNGSISSPVCGASVIVGFRGTRQVALQVDSDSFPAVAPARYPILAWSVNGGPVRMQQLAPKQKSIPLAADASDPLIELYIKGMSPFEDRWSGEIPPNSVKITGFSVDAGGTAVAADIPGKIWLNIGDSIMSGDGAAYAEGQGRPKNDLWPEAGDGRASYGYLLAKHFGYREARIAFGGYNWRGGMAKVPALTTLIDQSSAAVSRLHGGVLSPPPDVALVNLGENGAPADKDVVEGLKGLRRRAGKTAKIIVMVPLSGQGRAQVTRAFQQYQDATHDDLAFLVDLGRIRFATADRQHPTAAGHQEVFRAALPALEAILTVGKQR